MAAPPPIDAKDRILAQVFYHRATGFGSIADTYREAHSLDPSISKADVREFLAKQEIRQRHKPARYNSFVADLPREEIQIDLADFGERASPRYCLVAIDIFSKVAWGVPIANKQATATRAALGQVFEHIGYPETIMCDEGGEFHGEFAEEAKRQGVSIIYSRTGGRFVERFIRTLKLDLFERVRSLGGSWSHYLDDVIDRYNHHKSDAHNAKPDTVQAKQYNFPFVHNIWERLMRRARFPVKHTPIEVGDHVKIRIKPPSAGYKETTSSWSEKVYTVERIDRGADGGDKYHLEAYRRPLLRFELLRVADVQRSVAGELRSVLGSRQHPRLAPAEAAHALRRGQPEPPVFRPATRASVAAASGSGLTAEERARVPTLQSGEALPAPVVAPAPAAPAPKAAPKAAAPKKPPPPLFARNTRSTRRS